MSEMLEKILVEYIEKNNKLQQSLINMQNKINELESQKCCNKEHSQLLLKIQQVKKILLTSNINKTGYNKYSKYYYFDLGDIIPVVECALLEKKCSSMFFCKDDKMFLRITDTETGAYEEWDTKLKIYKRDKVPNGDLTFLMKDEQAAQTYSRRTLLLLALNIVEPVQETPENNKNSKKTEAPEKNHDTKSRPFNIPETAPETVKNILLRIQKDFGNKVSFNNTTLRNKLNSLKKYEEINDKELEETVQVLLEMGFRL